MGITIILVGALVALIAAWFVRSLVGVLSGERAGSLLRTWWDIFSHLGARRSSYAEPLPEVLTQRKFMIGDRVRVLLLPPDLERTMSKERQGLFRRCVGRSCASRQSMLSAYLSFTFLTTAHRALIAIIKFCLSNRNISSSSPIAPDFGASLSSL
jgi:hypothetical protein